MSDELIDTTNNNSQNSMDNKIKMLEDQISSLQKEKSSYSLMEKKLSEIENQITSTKNTHDIKESSTITDTEDIFEVLGKKSEQVQKEKILASFFNDYQDNIDEDAQQKIFTNSKNMNASELKKKLSGLKSKLDIDTPNQVSNSTSDFASFAEKNLNRTSTNSPTGRQQKYYFPEEQHLLTALSTATAIGDYKAVMDIITKKPL